MQYPEQFILLLIFLYSLLAFLSGFRNRKNPFGISRRFLPFSAFVFIDSVVFGPFFVIVSLFCLLLNQWILFLLIFSVFWTVRSIGEQVYWFHEQFAVKHRNVPSTLWPHKLFKGEEIWVVMQTFWQCISVIGIILSVYLFYIWFRSLT